ncbi:hypothetical protein DEO72_LG4g1541 [Vigna unguiculata]|uniref:Uncharacterized protein n=1 Tax=Vigna unguiculata TaxID=3917 RepID=A0A4D6LRH7_VIGUN|nr:hypothetical protein DEO72_LG4g1541 [Vigna unguiculata]
MAPHPPEVPLTLQPYMLTPLRVWPQGVITQSSHQFSAQPQIPTLSLSIKISFQTCRGPSVEAPLGWRLASFFSHFSMLGTAGLALCADPVAFFKA